MPKISVNAPCICGSGKKFKKCCMKEALIIDKSLKRLAVIKPILIARDEKAAEFRAIQREQLKVAAILCGVITVLILIAVYWLR